MTFEPSHQPYDLVNSPTQILTETIYTTLMRDHNGLGFSIAGGRGAAQFKEGTDAIFVSRITEGGAAAKDGKLRIGDRVISINGVDLDGARHDQAVSMLTGLERFVRLVVHRETLVPHGQGNNNSRTSPRVFGAPRPYTGLYSAGSYMANRPSYTGYRRAQPGGRLSGSNIQDANHSATTSPAASPSVVTKQQQRQQATDVAAEIPGSTGGPIAAGATQEVTLYKDGGPLGLSIIGGSDHFCVPFGTSPDDPGIYISKITAGGAAHRTQKLRMGDRILSVNGDDMSGATHQEAVMALLNPPNEIVLSIRHDPQPKGLKEVVIKKLVGERLGMNIKGGVQGSPGNPLDKSDEGVFISKINSNGAAHRDGRLKVGQRVLEVNESSLLGITHEEAVNVMRGAGSTIRIVVCDGYDHQLVQQMKAEGRLGHESRSTSHSVTSLDKDDRDNTTQVMEVVRAAEQLTSRPSSQNSAVVPSSPLERKASAESKKTTVVLAKHTLAPQTSTQEVETPAENTKKVTLKDRMKFFEDEMKRDKEGPPKESRKFSFLSQDEVAKMKEDEDRRIANMTPDQLANLSRLEDVEEMADDLAQQFGVSGDYDHRKYNDVDILAGLKEVDETDTSVRPAFESGVVRTAKAEKRAQSRENQINEDEQLSPADKRRAEAEKRAAWRQARLKSLENDALQAQYVIEKYSELSETSNDKINNDNSKNNSNNITDQDNNVPVEMCRETLVTLSLTDAENANTSVEGGMTDSIPEATIDTNMENEETLTTKEEQIKRRFEDENLENIKALQSVNDDNDSVENSLYDQGLGDGVPMSTDDSELEISPTLPQTLMTPDENANSKR